MNQEEFANHYHRQQFKLVCYEKKGDEFQDFFALIMEKHDTSFIPVKNHGKDGDLKCDGYSQDSKTVYQCYAPENLEKGKTIYDAQIKVQADFEGAKKLWFTEKGKWLKNWVFVWSHYQKLPAQIVQSLQQIKDDEKEITIDDWGLERLWQIIESLQKSQRNEILGIVPSLETVTEVTAKEISVLLDILAVQDSQIYTEDFDLLKIPEKLKKNGIGQGMQNLIKAAVPMTTIITDYLSKLPTFQEKITDVMIEKYKEYSEQDMSSDEIIWQLIRYVQSPKYDSQKHFFAAVGIVAHYFQLCTIFEK